MNMTSSTRNLKNTLATLCVAGTFLAATTAQAGWTTWNNGSGDGKWETAANWSGGVPDISTDAAIINSVSTAGAVTASTGTYSFDYLRVGHLDSGTLTINGANLSTTPAGSGTREGIGYDAGHVGILNLISGSMNFSTSTTATNQTTLIGGVASTGTVYQTGGTMSFGGTNTTSVTLGSTNGTALYDFTAGTLVSRRAFNMTTGGTGTSVFKVNGYSAGSSIQIGGTAANGDGAWIQGAGTKLSFAIDGATSQGTTLIDVRLGTDAAANTNDGKATFASGSLLDLSFNSGAQSGTWTVLSAAGGIVNSGLALAPGVDSSIWSFAIVGNDLRVTALIVPVPEPSAFALIMGGCALLFCGRRRRK